MTKKEIIELMAPWQDDANVAVVVQLEDHQSQEDLEDGAVCEVRDAGYQPRIGYALYINPR